MNEEGERGMKATTSEHPCRVHHPDHMRGWEAFGIVGEAPTVRRLGSGRRDGKTGTTPWGKGETRQGVASVEIHTYADAVDSAYIYVCGSTEKGVAKAWGRAETAFKEIRSKMWT